MAAIISTLTIVVKGDLSTIEFGDILKRERGLWTFMVIGYIWSIQSHSVVPVLMVLPTCTINSDIAAERNECFVVKHSQTYSV